MTLGRAFDVTVKRTQTDFSAIAKRVTESTHRLEFVNGGAVAAVVRVEETIPGDWRILEQSDNYVREGADAVWRVTVPAKGAAALTYRVRVER